MGKDHLNCISDTLNCKLDDEDVKGVIKDEIVDYNDKTEFAEDSNVTDNTLHNCDTANDNVVFKSSNRNNKILCDFCKKYIPSKTFKRHQFSHSELKCFVCDLCGKGFKNSGAISRHVKEVHLRLLRFACDVCGAKFACKRTMEEHKNTHSSKLSYVCDTCGKQFRLRSSLNIHIKIHALSSQFQCASCPKKFKRKQELKSHVSIHSGHKPFGCSLCSRTFRLRSELNSHSVTHNDVKNFQCHVCQLKFKQKRYLNCHVLKKHRV